MCPPWLGCCVRFAGLVASLGLSPGLSPNLSPTWLCLSPWAGVLCPPRSACLPICLPPSFVLHLGLGCCVRLAWLVSQFVSQFVSHLALVLSPNLSPTWLCLSCWAGVLCPPRSACLPICLPSGFVFHLGWGAVSASLGLSPGLSPNLSPTWLCLSPWAGVLCPPRSACLPICLPSGSCLRSCLPICLPPGFVFHVGLVCCVRLARCLRACLPICLPSGFVFHLGLGCCVRFAGLVSQFVSHLALSFTLGWGRLVSQFVSEFVSHLALSFTLGWGAVSASLGLSPGLSPNLSPAWLCLSPWAGVLCPLRWACLPICLPPGFVFHLGLGCCVRLARLVSQFVSHLALSFTLGWGAVSPNLSPIWLCLSPWLGCCVRFAGLVWACLPICLPPGFLPQTVYCCGSQCCLKCVRLGWGAVSASQSLSPVSEFVSQCVSHLALSFTLAGALCPRWLFSQFVCHLALCPSFVSPFVSHRLPICLPICLPSGFVSQFCLPICSPSGFVFHLGWGAVSASLGLSPVLSPNLSPIWLCLPVLSPHLFPIWLCLSPWLGCCVRLSGLVSGLVSQFVSHLALSPSFVSPFVSHLALSFTLVGVLCPPRWGCLWSCLPNLCPNLFAIWLCLPVLSSHLFPIWLCLSSWLGCCVRFAGLVSGLVSQCVSHLALSQFCLPICSPSGFVWCCVRLVGLVSQFVSQICLLSGFVFHLGWGAVSASLGLSPNLSPTWLSPWLGCCVRLAGLVSQFVS